MALPPALLVTHHKLETRPGLHGPGEASYVCPGSVKEAEVQIIRLLQLVDVLCLV